VFERFTQRARQVLVLAEQESDRLGHDYLGPEHVLAGIAAQSGSPAERVLRNRGLDAAAIRAELDRLVRQGTLPPRWRNHAELLGSVGIDLAAVRRSMEEAFGGQAVGEATRRVSRRSWWRGGGAAWTPLCGKAAAAKQAFYLAGIEADALGRKDVDPEHVLLGVLRDAEAPARWTRRNRRVRALLGFPPQPGPHPVQAVIQARGQTVQALREAILAELHATT
jgi:ATP-dependent Clp protease ATP-binding subunit ClpA